MDIYLITSSTKQINVPVRQRQTAPYDTNPFLQPRVHESRGVRELYGCGRVKIFKRVLLCCDQGNSIDTQLLFVVSCFSDVSPEKKTNVISYLMSTDSE